MKFPSFSHFVYFFKVLSKKEKISLLVFSIALIGSLSVLSASFYYKNTKVMPASRGTYVEGELGSPRFLNPVYADSFDVDRDITELLFSGLMKYDENGHIVPDLAADYKINEDGKVYEFFLKDNVYWSDGQRLTSDDIIYTIKTISDPAYKSPLRARWLGVEMEKISDVSLRFKLKNPYSSFLESCTTKIIPRHIWQNVSAENFPLSPFNLEPVGSGPYRLAKVNKTKEGDISSIDLAKNPHYYGKKPYIEQFSFSFFNDYESLVTAFKRGFIKGFALNSVPEENFSSSFKGANSYTFSFPRYFAAFFNPEKSKPFSDAAVRQALNYGTDKNEIINNVLNKEGKAVESPILPEIYGFNGPSAAYNYDPAKAGELLDKAEFKTGENGMRVKTVSKNPAFQFTKNMSSGSKLDPDVKELQKCLQKEVAPDLEANGVYGPKTKEAVAAFQEKYRKDILDPNNVSKPTGEILATTRGKLNEICFPKDEEKTPLKFTISTVNQPVLIKVAEALKTQWQKLGVEIEVKSYDISILEREVIKPREYEILLFGEVLGAVPDPYPFWHSTQKIDPGLNLALYENKDCDKLLKETRETLDENARREKLQNFQETLIKDAPAVFLYNPDYFYLTSGEVKGVKAKIIVDPSKRFSGVENWYLKTRRIWK